MRLLAVNNSRRSKNKQAVVQVSNVQLRQRLRARGLTRTAMSRLRASSALTNSSLAARYCSSTSSSSSGGT